MRVKKIRYLIYRTTGNSDRVLGTCFTSLAYIICMQDSRKKEKVKATIRLSVESGLSIPTKRIVNKIYIVHQTFFFSVVNCKSNFYGSIYNNLRRFVFLYNILWSNLDWHTRKEKKWPSRQTTSPGLLLLVRSGLAPIMAFVHHTLTNSHTLWCLWINGCIILYCEGILSIPPVLKGSRYNIDSANFKS